MTSDNQQIDLYDDSTPVYSSQSQTLITKLDRVASQDLQTLYANCYDSNGGYARTTKTVTVTAMTTIVAFM
jgi:hypothetical protein